MKVLQLVKDAQLAAEQGNLDNYQARFVADMAMKDKKELKALSSKQYNFLVECADKVDYSQPQPQPVPAVEPIAAEQPAVEAKGEAVEVTAYHGCFHMLQKPTFMFCDAGEPGIHFAADKELARQFAQRSGANSIHQGYTENSRLHTCKLSFKNAIRVRDTFPIFSENAFQALAAAGIITESEAREINEDIFSDSDCFYSNRHKARVIPSENEALRREACNRYVKLIKNAGFDGIIYENESESEQKGATCYVVLDCVNFELIQTEQLG